MRLKRECVPRQWCSAHVLGWTKSVCPWWDKILLFSHWDVETGPFLLESPSVSMFAWTTECSRSYILELLGPNIKMTCSFYLDLLEYAFWEKHKPPCEGSYYMGAVNLDRPYVSLLQDGPGATHVNKAILHPRSAQHRHQLRPTERPSQCSRKITHVSPTKLPSCIIARCNKIPAF